MITSDFFVAMSGGFGNDEYTYFLLHCDGANNSTTFTDSSFNSRTMTVSGNTKVSTTQSKFGGASGYFDGASDWITPGTVNIGTSAFTFDCWINLTSLSTRRTIFSLGGANTEVDAGFCLEVRNDGLLHITSSGVVLGYGLTTVSLNTWHHVAIVGNGGSSGNRSYCAYLDGVLQWTLMRNYDISQTCYIGTNTSEFPYSFLGWLDEIRLSVGIQRWTSDFPTPEEEYIVL